MLRLISFGLLALLGYLPIAQANAAITSKTVILVRHGEKATQGRDPSLNDAGKLRAQALVESLADTPLTLAISTQFKRTQETLAPLIAAKGIPLIVIDAGREMDKHIAAIVDSVMAQEGNVVIAGHSNTVPLIIKALRGPEIPQLGEDEYDNLFILSLHQDGPSSLIKTQYGASSSNTQ
ncbi:phosphoglycerate mutase family protein [Shewanella sp. Isolate7]|uniref:phosphoglycerate mutase family protein n=1 Tax=Shewanella sp. Isolate7 TaxID=2908528 RepID=UPI001EFCD617|nr:phosphoglycerate mutase family protein [Shewanella sp. Isolate7]MCG9721314.1 histidine phosphatase family protein [Shewanella sp. Isolate7]